MAQGWIGEILDRKVENSMKRIKVKLRINGKEMVGQGDFDLRGDGTTIDLGSITIAGTSTGNPTSGKSGCDWNCSATCSGCSGP